MTEMLLYMAPGSCSRVPLIALIEAEALFDTALVRFMKGQHKSSDYKRLNPKGKVPVLIVAGEPLTENVAILSFLNARFPAANLLPPVSTKMDAARQIADLAFCSSTLHPLVSRMRMPGLFAGPDARQDIWDKACAAMRDQLQLVEDRLADGDWWYGESWSVMDAYLGWAFWRIEGAGFAVADYPRLSEHNLRLSARSAFQKAMKIEDAASAKLEAEGLTFKLTPIDARK